MTNIKTFKVKINNSRVLSLTLETYGMSETQIDNALDQLVLEYSYGQDVESGVHYF